MFVYKKRDNYLLVVSLSDRQDKLQHHFWMIWRNWLTIFSVCLSLAL